MLNLATETELRRHSNAVAAGQTVITPSNGIDMAGFNGVMFVCSFGAIAAGAETSIEVHESDDDSSYSLITGSNKAVAATDDNKVGYIEILRPRKRYLKCIVNRATGDATLDSILAILHSGRRRGAFTHSTVLGGVGGIAQA